MERQDRVRIRLLVPPIVNPTARVPRCDGEEGKEEEVEAAAKGKRNVGAHGVGSIRLRAPRVGEKGAGGVRIKVGAAAAIAGDAEGGDGAGVW